MDQIHAKFSILIFVFSATLLFLCQASGAETKQRSELSGAISFVNPVMITLVYGQDRVEGAEKEATLYRNFDIRYFNRYRWEDIKVGDHLKVVLTETTEPQERLKSDGTIELINQVRSRTISEIYFPEDGSTSLTS